MEQGSDRSKAIEASSWQPINNWKDVEPFAGKIVAYKAMTCYFVSEYQYSLPADSSIIYGYIERQTTEWITDEEGYGLVRFYKKDGIRSNIALIDSQLKGAFLHMKIPTSSEKTELLQAVRSNKADFFPGSRREEILSTLGNQEADNSAAHLLD